ncbi:MAG: hypothetical protein WCM76_03260 [Bacteroidota bacterium]
MPGSYIMGMARLEKVIEALRKDLVRYSEKPNANDTFIDKQNTLIAELVTAFNDLDSLHFFETWQDIETQIRQLENIDPELNAHNIMLHLKPGSVTKYSRIIINPFEK